MTDRRNNGLILFAGKAREIGQWKEICASRSLSAVFTSAGEIDEWPEHVKLPDGYEEDAVVVLPSVTSINPRLLLERLRNALIATGRVSFIEADALSLSSSSTAPHRIETTIGSLEADVVIAACGFNGWEWLPESVRPELVPVRGEYLRLRGRTAYQGAMVGTPSGTLVPRTDGTLWVGVADSEGVSRATPSLDGACALHLLGNLKRWLAASDVELLQIGAGVRPISADGLPWIGLSGVEGLLLAAGAGRYGFLQAPLVSELMLSK